ncbi:MAG: amidase family protein [Candidatus Woesearchaeota archaeon]
MKGFSVQSNIQVKKSGLLKDITVSFKDCICVKDLETTSSSKILKGYVPNFDATIVTKIKNEGAKIIGKTYQDEFGFGSFGLNNEAGLKNPNDESRVPGGSSAGSAIAARTIKNHLAIAESTGGSIVNPAAFCGVIGICPTYGRVSRYGLIDYANSLDKIGVMADNLQLAALGIKIISGYDEKDSTSVNIRVEEFQKFSDFKSTLGIPKEYVEGLDEEVKELFNKKIAELKNKGIKIIDVSLPLNSKYSIPTYYVIALSESSTNLSKYSGIRYGPQLSLNNHYDKYFSMVREKFFGKESKRRIILGTFTRMAGYRSKYYIKALKVRTLLIKEYKKVFEKVDGLIHPTMPFIPPKIVDANKLTPIQIYNMDLFTAGANLAGLPHISIPLSNMIGIMITTDHFKEKLMIDIGAKI